MAVFRIIILAFTPTDLFFDEAQYWAWSQDLSWGYFSKPPLIAWVIRLTTEIGGSDAPFWVRLAAPVLHSITAVVLGLWVATIKPSAAIWAAAIYLSMPILAVGSWMISTDTVMAPFLAGALWAWWRHLETRSLRTALFAGVLVGLAMMAKYAGAYFWLVVATGALFGGLRPRISGIFLAVMACLLVIAPNMLWNLQNGLITFTHTAENASWDEGVKYNWASLAEFAAAQLMVIGPVMFLAWLLALWQAKSRFETYLICASVPILLLVCVQAFVSQAYANWAFAAYLAAAPLAAVWVTDRRCWKLLFSGLGVNAAISLIVVCLLIYPSLAPRVMDRYLGRETVMKEIIGVADGVALAATERQLLADLTYVAKRGNGTSGVFALKRGQPPSNWYEMVALRPSGAAVYFVSDGPPPACDADDIKLEHVVEPQTGAYRGRILFLYLVPGSC